MNNVEVFELSRIQRIPFRQQLPRDQQRARRSSAVVVSTLDGVNMKVWFHRGAGIADQPDRLTYFDIIPRAYGDGAGLHVAQQDAVSLAEENDVIPKRVVGIRIHRHAVREHA